MRPDNLYHTGVPTCVTGDIPVKRMLFNPATGIHTEHLPTEKFIKGPIPLKWISQANSLPGKAGAIGLALWFFVGIKKSHTFKLTREVQFIAGCERKAVYSALKSLERAGLICVRRLPGATPEITLVDFKK